MKKLLLLMISSIALVGCSRNNPTDKHIVVGASSTPHAIILEHIKPYVEEEGYSLDIKVMSDYVTPNLSLESGDLDANYFQHEPYLNDFNEKNHTNIVSAFKVHFEPMGIYSKKHNSLVDTLGVKVAVPNDTSNYARAIDLLEKTISTLGIEIIQMEAQAIPAALDDVDYACINGNYALSSGVTDKCLATESSDSEIASINANIIAVRKQYQDQPFVSVLRKCLLSEHTRKFITETFGSSVLPMF